MYWFYLDIDKDQKRWALVLAIGDADGIERLWLAGEGWATRAEHEARGWKLSARAPVLPVSA